jgi:hypothetical protein
MHAKGVNVYRSAPFFLVQSTKPPTVRTKRRVTYTDNVDRGVVLPRLTLITDNECRDTTVVQSPST